MDGWNWNGELTQYLWKKGSLKVIVSNKQVTLKKSRSLQVASWNIDVTTQMCEGQCSFEITTHLKDIAYIQNLAASAFLKKNTVTIEKWISATTLRVKETLYSPDCNLKRTHSWYGKLRRMSQKYTDVHSFSEYLSYIWGRQIFSYLLHFNSKKLKVSIVSRDGSGKTGFSHSLSSIKSYLQYQNMNRVCEEIFLKGNDLNNSHKLRKLEVT